MSDKLNIEYCSSHCPKGIETRNKFLDENNSVYDAVIDFWAFTDKCFEACPLKDKHTKDRKDN